jgi:gephyrin
VEGKLDEALAWADVLLTSGGVSMGDRDFIKPILEQRGYDRENCTVQRLDNPHHFAFLITAVLGALFPFVTACESSTVHFGRVLMKPGKPLTFATVERPSGRPLLVSPRSSFGPKLPAQPPSES